jgi:hypothetical protein
LLEFVKDRSEQLQKLQGDLELLHWGRLLKQVNSCCNAMIFSDSYSCLIAVENRQQVTAIVTGVISILLAVGYLSLLSLDTRGVNLIPPPPEAYGE